MYSAYCMWRFAGVDPADFLVPPVDPGEPERPRPAEERMRAVRIAMALRAGSHESALVDIAASFGAAGE